MYRLGISLLNNIFIDYASPRTITVLIFDHLTETVALYMSTGNKKWFIHMSVISKTRNTLNVLDRFLSLEVEFWFA